MKAILVPLAFFAFMGAVTVGVLVVLRVVLREPKDDAGGASEGES